LVKDVTEFSKDNHGEFLKLHGKYVVDVVRNKAGILVWSDLSNDFVLIFYGERYSGIHGIGTVNGMVKLGQLALKPNFNRHQKWLNFDLGGHRNL